MQQSQLQILTKSYRKNLKITQDRIHDAQAIKCRKLHLLGLDALDRERAVTRTDYEDEILTREEYVEAIKDIRERTKSINDVIRKDDDTAAAAAHTGVSSDEQV